jgi:hypothetical protein
MMQSTIGGAIPRVILVRLCKQGCCYSRARLRCPVDISTRLQVGRLPILRRTGATPQIVTSVTLLGDRRITIISSGG